MPSSASERSSEQDLVALVQLDAGDGLVEEEQPRSERKRVGDREANALLAVELADVRVAKALAADAPQRLACARMCLLASDAVDEQAEQHLVDRGLALGARK